MDAPWLDPTLRMWEKALRLDPCAYCGQPRSGTVDHITPRAQGGGKYDMYNMTGACETCNRRKDKNGEQHQSILQFMAGRRQAHASQGRELVRSKLHVGDLVYTPWGEAGAVRYIGKRSVYVRLERGKLWRCGNPLALRNQYGTRIWQTLR